MFNYVMLEERSQRELQLNFTRDNNSELLLDHCKSVFLSETTRWMKSLEYN